MLVQDLATKVTVVLTGGLFCKSILGKGDPKPCSFLLSFSLGYQEDDGQRHFMDVSLLQEEAQSESRARAWDCLTLKATCWDQHEGQAGYPGLLSW